MDIVLLLHSLVRYLILLLAVAGIVSVIVNVTRQTPNRLDRTLGSVFLGLYDVQILVGLLIILLGGLTQAGHPVIMFVGVIIAHALQAMSKRAQGTQAKWTRLAFYIIPLLIILVGLAVISRLPY